MKKGEFDLTGEAIDCRGFPALGDAGKEIFRALKVACNGVGKGADKGRFSSFEFMKSNADNRFCALILNEKGNYHISFVKRVGLLNPSDVLGQAAIDAAMGGATIVFEGDDLPNAEMILYQCTGQSFISNGGYCIGEDSMAISYKLLEEKPRHRVTSIESRVLSEKMGFKELCPVCSTQEWADREAETYDELRDAHIDLVRDTMDKDKEIKLLKQRIKDMHRAINDALAALDV